MKIAFIDIETTGLDPDRHDVWDIGLVLAEDHTDLDNVYRMQWYVRPDLGAADPGALRVNRYYQRTKGFTRDNWSAPSSVATTLARLTEGAYMAGMNVDFDVDFLEKFLRKHDACPAWEYKPIELESMMLGMLCEYNRAADFVTSMFPFKSTTLSMFIGVNAEEFDRHTAFGDAEWAYTVFRKVTGL